MSIQLRSWAASSAKQTSVGSPLLPRHWLQEVAVQAAEPQAPFPRPALGLHEPLLDDAPPAWPLPPPPLLPAGAEPPPEPLEPFEPWLELRDQGCADW